MLKLLEPEVPVREARCGEKGLWVLLPGEPGFPQRKTRFGGSLLLASAILKPPLRSNFSPSGRFATEFRVGLSRFRG